MEVAELPLPPTLRSKLQAAGYLTLDRSISPIQLAEDAEITPKEALDILKLVPKNNILGSGSGGESIIEGAQTAWDILHDEKARKRIVTSCRELDDILGGGIGSKEVTEISGAPGVGKTQLGIQLSINVQIPPEFGGIGGHAVYIDTEGSFMIERASQMAESCIEDIEIRAPADLQVELEELKDKLNFNTFLSHIYYFRVHSAAEQIAVVNRMEHFLSEHKQVRLIVIDSVAFHFRQGFESMGERTRILCSLAQTLVGLSEKYELAVVIINQITHKFTEEGAKVQPALGETWAHSTTNRLALYWGDDGQRHALLLKSPSLPRKAASYTISSCGIRSVGQNMQQAPPD
ncbi:unnamed protein product [Calypogeia fissa]